MANGGEEEQEGKETNIWTKKIFGPRRRKRTKKEKEENIWRRKIFVPRRRKRAENERRKIFGLRRRKRTENIWSAEEMKNGEGKGGNYSEEEN